MAEPLYTEYDYECEMERGRKPMQLKWKVVSDKAQAPYKAHPDDAGYDFTIIDAWVHTEDGAQVIRARTGVAVTLPDGYYMQISLRSSAWKYGVMLCNGVGIIDNGYRGEIIAVLKNTLPMIPDFVAAELIGKRILQGVLLPYVNAEVVQVDRLNETDRGRDGFGSTGP